MSIPTRPGKPFTKKLGDATFQIRTPSCEQIDELSAKMDELRPKAGQKTSMASLCDLLAEWLVGWDIPDVPAYSPDLIKKHLSPAEVGTLLGATVNGGAGPEDLGK